MVKKNDILLIHPSYNRRLGSSIMPPLGLAYLASFLRLKGFTSRILDCSMHFDTLSPSMNTKLGKWLRKRLKAVRPISAIGIGPCTTSAIRSIFTIAHTCKEALPDVPLIFGGPLTLIPEQSWLFFRELEAFAVVKGDGEIPLTKILARLCQREPISGIPGVQTSENQKVEPYFLKDLDSLPYPAWDMLRIDCYRPSIRRDLFANPSFPMVASRGCSFGCRFCISGQYIEYRRRSFENVAKEVKYLRDNYGVRSLIFYDDALFQDASKINEEIRLFSDSIGKAAPGILWQIEIRPDVFSLISGDTFEYIFARGCRQLNIGIEKMSQRELEFLGKPYSIDLFRETCELASKVCKNLRLSGTFILGGPKATLDSIHETIDLSTKLNLLFAHYTPLELYPGTPIYKMVFGQDNRAWYYRIMDDRWQWGEVIYESADISAKQLMQLVSVAYHRFYRRKEWQQRGMRCLGDNYQKVCRTIDLWEKDRFRLS